MSVKFGIMGLGGIAKTFAEAVNIVEGAELYGVASRDYEKAKEYQKMFNATNAYETYDDMLDDAEINSVYVAVLHNYHFDLVKKALQKGKNVICEKPMVLTVAECKELFAIAKENDVLLMEAMWTYCLPVTKKVKSWISEGAIGAVDHIHLRMCFDATKWDPEYKGRLFAKEKAGGALYDVGVYTLEYPMGILGELPTNYTGMCIEGQTGVDFSSSTMVQYPCGAIATASCSVANDSGNIAEVCGKTGRIIINSFYNAKKCERYDNKNNLIETFIDEGYEKGFCYEVEHFMELVLSGKKESDLVTEEITTTCAEIMESLICSWGIQ